MTKIARKVQAQHCSNIRDRRSLKEAEDFTFLFVKEDEEYDDVEDIFPEDQGSKGNSKESVRHNIFEQFGKFIQ